MKCLVLPTLFDCLCIPCALFAASYRTLHPRPSCLDVEISGQLNTGLTSYQHMQTRFLSYGPNVIKHDTESEIRSA